MRTRTALIATLLATFTGCACDSVPSDAIESCEATHVLPGTVSTDILFVIDDSGSMDGEQTIVQASLDAFVQQLALSPVQNEWRIGVTTTSVEAFNATTVFPAGGPEAGNPFPAGAIVAAESTTPGDLVYDLAAHPATNGWGGVRVLSRGATPAEIAAFSQNFRVGTSGSGKEQSFRAARLALSDRIADGTNAGFLRDGARLAVIMISDEDDCTDTAAPFATTNTACHDDAFKLASLDPVDEFAAFLLGPVAGEQRDVVIGAFFWPPGAPACTAPADALDDGDRFTWLVDAVGAARMRTGNVCADFSTSLIQFAEILVPSSLPLEGSPADYRMLVVTLSKAAGGTVPCAVALEGTAEQATAGAVYSGPRLGRPAMLTFQGACTLELGDRIDVKVVCAG